MLFSTSIIYMRYRRGESISDLSNYYNKTEDDILRAIKLAESYYNR